MLVGEKLSIFFQTIPALRQFIVSTLSLLDPSADTGAITEAANQIIDLETELAKVMYLSLLFTHLPTAKHSGSVVYFSLLVC